MNEGQRNAIAAQLKETGFLDEMASDLSQTYYEQWRQHISQRERIALAHDLMDDFVKLVLYYAEEGKPDLKLISGDGTDG